MSCPSMSSEQKSTYIRLIDDILKASDLEKVTSKNVRRQLEAKLGYDVSHHKDAIKELIGERFDKVQSTNGYTNGGAEEIPTSNGVVKSVERSHYSPPTRPVKDSPPKRSAPADESDLSDVVDERKPAKKRKQATAEDDDAAFAARLQDEENKRARPTRGGSTKKRAPVKKDKSLIKKKKKSSTKIKADDDSDLSSVEDAAPKERKGGFHKPMGLSQPLADLVGETVLSRPQTVKKVWEHIKAHDLQDPSDKRQIICDDAMRLVFKTDRVHMFTMNKILNQNLYAQDE